MDIFVWLLQVVLWFPLKIADRVDKKCGKLHLIVVLLSAELSVLTVLSCCWYGYPVVMDRVHYSSVVRMTTEVDSFTRMHDVDEHDYNSTMYYVLEDILQVDPTLKQRLVDNGYHGVVLTGSPAYTLPGQEDTRTTQARGHRAGTTVAQIGAYYDPSARLIVIDITTRGGMEHVVGHELGHMVDDLHYQASLIPAFQKVWKQHGKALGDYFWQDGDPYAGASEYFAEVFAYTFEAETGNSRDLSKVPAELRNWLTNMVHGEDVHWYDIGK